MGVVCLMKVLSGTATRITIWASGFQGRMPVCRGRGYHERHQEHPANFTWIDVVENVTYICEKYNHIYYWMQMVCLQEVLKADSGKINLVAVT